MTPYMFLTWTKLAEHDSLVELPHEDRALIAPFVMLRSIATPRPRKNEATGESVPVKPPTYKQHLATGVAWLRRVSAMPPGLFGSDFASLFVDVRALQRQQTRKSVLRDVFKALGDDAKRYVPAIAENSSRAHWRAAGAWHAKHRCGVALRVLRDRRRKFWAPALKELVAAARAAGCAPGSVDLVIDVGHVTADDIDGLAVALPAKLRDYCTAPWRTVTLAAGGFPKSIGDLDFAKTPLPRLDYILWLRVAAALRKTGSRLPLFGDYGMLHPTPSGGFAPEIAPNLRVTCDLVWDVYRRGRPGDVREMCESIIADHPKVRKLRTWGDKWVAARADGETERRRGKDEEVTGNATTWLKAGLSGHLPFVARQMSGSS